MTARAFHPRSARRSSHVSIAVSATPSPARLGLAISREMAARFGGTVVLGEAASGRGVRAVLTLPLA